MENTWIEFWLDIFVEDIETAASTEKSKTARGRKRTPYSGQGEFCLILQGCLKWKNLIVFQLISSLLFSIWGRIVFRGFEQFWRSVQTSTWSRKEFCTASDFFTLPIKAKSALWNSNSRDGEKFESATSNLTKSLNCKLHMVCTFSTEYKL